MDKFNEVELAQGFLRFGLTYEKISAFDILCLPENISYAKSETDLFDASEAILLSKLLKEKGIKCANSFDFDLPTQILDRRGNEKWYGLVCLRTTVMIPIFVGVISGVLTEIISENLKSPNEPPSKIHIELKIEKPNNISTIKYDGDPQTFLTILKNIENEPKSEK